ncbi:uncharacterized protein [Euphorbia lathyris]|uniref:uncharacterized protein n=1 Tax=Euphorbia lathyris TaxID=212925 RepID=UPI003313DE41
MRGTNSGEKMNREEEIEEEDDERRETALTSTPSLQPGFKPTRISQDQVSKLHELHRRRLKIKSKIHKKLKDGNGRSYCKDLNHDDGKTSVSETEHSKASDLKRSQGNIAFSAQQNNVAALDLQKKRQKLYWGLDTRERWERKANM